MKVERIGRSVSGLPTLDEVKRRAVEERLRTLGGDKYAAAASLGVSPGTLYNNLHRWNMIPPRRKNKTRGKK